MLNKINSLSKIIGCLLLIFSILLCHNFLTITVMFLITLILVFFSSKNLIYYVKKLKTIFIFLLFLILMFIFLNKSLEYIIVQSSKLILIIWVSSFLIITTSTNDLILGITNFLKPLKIFKVNYQKLSFMLGMSISLIPVLYDQSIKIKKATLSRNINYDNKNYFKKIFSIKANIFPLFILSIKRADIITDSFEVRGLDIEKNHVERIIWTKKDYVYIIFTIFILILIAIGGQL